MSNHPSSLAECNPSLQSSIRARSDAVRTRLQSTRPRSLHGTLRSEFEFTRVKMGLRGLCEKLIVFHQCQGFPNHWSLAGLRVFRRVQKRGHVLCPFRSLLKCLELCMPVYIIHIQLCVCVCMRLAVTSFPSFPSKQSALQSRNVRPWIPRLGMASTRFVSVRLSQR